MHCPTCNANRETYTDDGPGETWHRCAICNKILRRVPKIGNGAALQRLAAQNVIHGAYNMHELSRKPSGRF
jgi:hypothetical protein